MLTLESRFVDFVTVCSKAGACVEAVEWMDKQLALNKDMTFGDAMKNFVSDEKALEGWASWNIETLGKELGSDAIDGFISKIKDPKTALRVLAYKLLSNANIAYLKSVVSSVTLQDIITDPMEAARLYIDCPHLTVAQETSLKAVYEGKLPTVEKELRDGVITRATAEVAP